ncbi:putative defense protein Hdd11 [Haliotis asinina]|uniref:putative defense protein Hdd11 n=1 Tax=Haliotis asinina TaxID=109174 RepID=UPI003531F338
MKPCIIFVEFSVLIFNTGANVFHLSNCIDMVPSDLTSDEQTSLQPFRVTVSTTEYEDGEPVNVVLSSADISTTFVDFFLQARCLTCSNLTVPVGTFTIPAGQPPSETLACFNTMAAVTASSMDPKTSVTFSWMPPPGFTDVVIMRATFVKNHTEWWGNVVSQTMNVMSVPLAVDVTISTARPRPTRPPTTLSPSASSCTAATSSFGLTLGILMQRLLVF